MFSDLVDLAIAENKDFKELNKEIDSMWKRTTGKVAYLRERCTVHINIGRAVGKTFYIAKHATENDVIIMFSKMGKELLYEKGCSKKVIRIYNTLLDLKRISLKNIDFVYIDEPRLFCRNQDCNLYDIYELFACTEKEPTFVLLGE